MSCSRPRGQYLQGRGQMPWGRGQILRGRGRGRGEILQGRGPGRIIWPRGLNIAGSNPASLNITAIYELSYCIITTSCCWRRAACRDGRIQRRARDRHAWPINSLKTYATALLVRLYHCHSTIVDWFYDYTCYISLCGYFRLNVQNWRPHCLSDEQKLFRLWAPLSPPFTQLSPWPHQELLSLESGPIRSLAPWSTTWSRPLEIPRNSSAPLEYQWNLRSNCPPCTMHLRGHELKLTKHRSKLEVRRHFFTERLVNRWNSLDHHTVNASTVNSFKNGPQRLKQSRMDFFEDWSPTGCTDASTRLVWPHQVNELIFRISPRDDRAVHMSSIVKIHFLLLRHISTITSTRPWRLRQENLTMWRDKPSHAADRSWSSSSFQNDRI